MSKYARFDERALALTDAGGRLFKGELHFIKCVREHPADNPARLAAVLGVTRGAVSQMTAKLEKKKLVGRVRRNGKEFTLKLTASGEEVYQRHEEFHARHFRELERAIDLLPASRIDFIEWVFRRIDRFYDTFEKRAAGQGRRG